MRFSYKMGLLWVTNVLASWVAVGMVFFLWFLPNSWLAFYGIAAVCAWEFLLILRKFVLENIQISEFQRTLYSVLLFLTSCTFLGAGILSVASSYWLAPRSIIQDVLGTVIYVSSACMVLLLFYYSYRLYVRYQGKFLEIYIQDNLKKFAKIQSWQNQQTKTLGTIWDDNLLTKKFSYSLFSFLGKRAFYVALWTLIPLWIFWIIPTNSQNPEATIHWIYTVGTIVTIVASLTWTAWLFICAKTSFEVHPQGIIRHRLGKSQKFFWHQIKTISVDEEHAYIVSNQKIWKIQVFEIQELWKQLCCSLPIEIFEISPKSIQKIAKLSEEHFGKFCC